MTKVKLWPYEGDSPTVKARKMALAYRHAGNQLEEALVKLRVLLAGPTITGETITAADKIFHEVFRDPLLSSLDQRFTDWGETWHCPAPVRYDDDDYVSAEVGGPLIHFSAGTLLHYRVQGKITGKWNPQLGGRGGWMFRVGDLYHFAAHRPRRGDNLRRKRAAGQATDPTDNITDSRSSDPE